MLKTILATTLLLAATTASAGFEYTRDTTVRDELNGQFRMTAAGTIGDEDGTRLAEGRYINFHPRNDASAVLDGTVTREAIRDGELVTISYDGTLSHTATATGNGSGNGNGNPQTRTTVIAFTDLTVERAEEGVTVSGQVTVNGQTVDASALPRPIKAIIVNALRLFRL